MRIFGLGAPELIIIVVILLISVVPLWFLWRVFQRTGMSGGFALLVLIPYVGPFITLGILAFARWPLLDGVSPAPGQFSSAPPAIPTPPTPPSATQPPAGWQPDPTGQYRLRYWDGSGWTDQVSD